MYEMVREGKRTLVLEDKLIPLFAQGLHVAIWYTPGQVLTFGTMYVLYR